MVEMFLYSIYSNNARKEIVVLSSDFRERWFLGELLRRVEWRRGVWVKVWKMVRLYGWKEDRVGFLGREEDMS